MKISIDLKWGPIKELDSEDSGHDIPMQWGHPHGDVVYS